MTPARLQQESLDEVLAPAQEGAGMFGDEFKGDDEQQIQKDEPVKQEQSEEDEESPLLFVDVNLGPND